MNRVHILTKITEHVKYESSMMKSSQNKERKTFLLLFNKRVSCDLDLWHSEPKINMILLSKTNQHVRCERYVTNSLILMENHIICIIILEFTLMLINLLVHN